MYFHLIFNDTIDNYDEMIGPLAGEVIGVRFC